MSEQEVRRSGVLKQVADGELTQKEASERLGLSYRQTKRLMARYRADGATGLVHGNAGRTSNRAKPIQLRKRVLKLVRERYQGPGEPFGPTLAAEHLEQDHGVRIDAETLRRWMLAEGLWQRERKRKRHRSRRTRKAHFGEMLQMDGSFEAWLEDRGPRGCLINLVDDATSTVLARIFDEETTWAVALTLRAWVEAYGIPRQLYVDWKNVYHHQPTARQRAEQQIPLSQFQRMCQKLGIELIGANSPQAKGRVERSHGTHQDRLIKKMRLKKFHDYQQANAFLKESYLSEHNRRFAVAAAEAVDFHDPVPASVDLDEVFCLEEERTVSADWVVQYRNRWLQIGPDAALEAGSKVLVRERADGTLHLWWRGATIAFAELRQRPAPPPVTPTPVRPRRPNVVIPPPEHPWRRSLLSQRGQSRAGQGKGIHTPSPSPVPPSLLPVR